VIVVTREQKYYGKVIANCQLPIAKFKGGGYLKPAIGNRESEISRNYP
jgi:hypothetical protein